MKASFAAFWKAPIKQTDKILTAFGEVGIAI
jgi:hypothetical protein